MKKNQAACVFAEPQFEPKMIRVVLEGTQARSGTLDPLGADLTDGPGLYFKLISNMADAMTDCLSGS
ncbi:metal ABC transporter solute-binding protein, Zn/Mn family [uncultured Roseibium sp.]|uniref:metal ABC transporter solute-binding protein, Zn/Mn family n=1 Tax=uncultured Roseibium sp. TaxID=1936171 RepID=UPI003217BD38